MSCDTVRAMQNTRPNRHPITNDKDPKGSSIITPFCLEPRCYLKVGSQRHNPAAQHPGKTRYPLYLQKGIYL
jgi:hypothetical protein